MSGAARLYGILGWPVRHSLSPSLHETAFHALGLDAVYARIPVPPTRLRIAMAGVKGLGLAGGNVTAPHKVEVMAMLDAVDEEARVVGAVNTLVREEAGLTGTNTDVEGFRRALAEGDVACGGLTALVLGAGGAARACVLALGREGIGRVVVAARDPQRGAEVAALASSDAGVVPFADAGSVQADLVVNATPLGWRGERLPVDPRSGQVVIDLVYASTPLLASARAAGAVPVDGRGMLLHQAALSVEAWTGQRAPLDAMRAALEVAIGP